VDGKNYEMASGLNPLNVQITPDGKLAIVNNIGGGQDGQVDTVGIIDLEVNPPRVVDQVVVGDGPEGLAISPPGDTPPQYSSTAPATRQNQPFLGTRNRSSRSSRSRESRFARWRRLRWVISPKASRSAPMGATFTSVTLSTATSTSCSSKATS